MAIANNDILRLTARFEYLSQYCLMVHFFRVSGIVGTPTYEEAAEDYASSWDSLVGPIVNTNCALTLVKVENLTNGLDIWEEPIVAIAGDVVGDPTPSFTAWSFQLVRTTKLTRHGSKRQPGVAEPSISGNTPVITAGAEANAETFFGSNLSVDDGAGNEMTLTPVIVGRVLNAAGDYELDLNKINLVSSAVFRGVSTQTSRKMGRGI